MENYLPKSDSALPGAPKHFCCKCFDAVTQFEFSSVTVNLGDWAMSAEILDSRVSTTSGWQTGVVLHRHTLSLRERLGVLRRAIRRSPFEKAFRNVEVEYFNRTGQHLDWDDITWSPAVSA